MTVEYDYRVDIKIGSVPNYFDADREQISAVFDIELLMAQRMW